jgi:uncharacterized membrane protein
LNVNPNPSSGIFQVTVSGVRDQVVTISVLDLQGKEVYYDYIKSNFNELTRTIDLSAFARSVYVVKIQTVKAQKVDKMIIQ